MDIEVRNVSVTYPSPAGDVRVLRHASLKLPAGKITALVGESGSGKSILGAAAMGLLDASARVEGEIFYGDTDLLSLSDSEMNALRGERIGWIAQDPVAAMDPIRRTGPQVTEALRQRLGHSEKAERENGTAQLRRFGLAEAERVYRSFPRELSGGMAQRVLTAMAAMPHPEWIIADEPTKGLDAFVRREVCRRFRKLRDEEGTGFLFITHDLRLAESLSDFIAILYAGEILELGRTEEVFRAPQHPYTKMFIEAQPSRSLSPIPGNPPDLSHLPSGCIFRARCPYGKRDCCGAAQVMRGTVHEVRCAGGELP